MKNGINLAVIIMLITSPFLIMEASSHTPEDMEIEYDPDMQILSVTITHKVDDPERHYIYKVEIVKNYALYRIELYPNQPTKDTFTYTYPVEADIGDELIVNAHCSIFGTITRSLIIKGDNLPPNTPTIYGPKRCKPEESYDYKFKAKDPDRDDIWYFINWGDSKSIYIYGPYNSGEEIILSKNWTVKGTYVITCWARDSYYQDSENATLKVTIPRNKYSTNLWLLQLLKRFPNMLPIIRTLLKLHVK